MINLNVNRIEAIRDKIVRGDGLVEFDINLLAIGGGGSGVAQGNNNKGGGAGGFISASWIIPPTTTFDVQIGSGSQDTLITLASDSSVVFRAPQGGGHDGNPGSVGGSSGAVGTGETPALTVPPTIPSTRTILAYRTGSKGGVGELSRGNAGGGGGVNGDGANANPLVPPFNPKDYASAGGSGININNTFVVGLVDLPAGTFLAGGGNGGYYNAETSYIPLPYSASTGHGGDGGADGNGASGLFAINYSGLPKASGGTITQSGGFTTHVFTGSGQLITTGRSNNNP